MCCGAPTESKEKYAPLKRQLRVWTQLEQHDNSNENHEKKEMREREYFLLLFSLVKKNMAHPAMYKAAQFFKYIF